MKKIPGLEPYYASRTGKIFERVGLNFKEVYRSLSEKGYYTVSLLGKTYRVNRIVCYAYKGPPPTEHHVACHKNGNSEDNRPDNLYWGTQSQNEIDKLHHGTHNFAKVTAKIVRKIRFKYAKRNCTQVELAKEFNLRQSTVSDIINRHIWEHVK